MGVNGRAFEAMVFGWRHTYQIVKAAAGRAAEEPTGC